MGYKNAYLRIEIELPTLKFLESNVMGFHMSKSMILEEVRSGKTDFSPVNESDEALEDFQRVAQLLAELEKEGKCSQTPLISKRRGDKYGKVVHVSVKSLI